MSSDDFADILFDELEKLDEGVSSTVEALESANEKAIIKRGLFSSEQKRLAQIGDIFLQKYIDLVKKTHDSKLSEKYFEEERIGFFKRIKEWFQKSEDDDEDEKNKTKLTIDDILNRGLLFVMGFNFLMGEKIKTFYENFKSVINEIYTFVSQMNDYVVELLTSDEAQKIYDECLGFALKSYEKFKEIVDFFSKIIDFKSWWDKIFGTISNFTISAICEVIGLSGNFIKNMWTSIWDIIVGICRIAFYDSPISGKKKHEIGVEAVASNINNINYISHGITHRIEMTETTKVVEKNADGDKTKEEIKHERFSYDALIGDNTRKQYMRQLLDTQSDVLSQTMTTFINSANEINKNRKEAMKKNMIPSFIIEEEKNKTENDLTAIYNEVPYFELDSTSFNSMVWSPMIEMRAPFFENVINKAIKFFFAGLIYSLSFSKNRKSVARNLLLDDYSKAYNISKQEAYNETRNHEIETKKKEIVKSTNNKTTELTDKDKKIFETEQTLISTFNMMRAAAEEQRDELYSKTIDSCNAFVNKILESFNQPWVH